MRILSHLLCLLFALFLSVSSCLAIEQPEHVIPSLGPTTVLGAKISMDGNFIAEDGTKGRLRDFAKDGRPFIVVPAYYHCQHLCGLVLKHVAELVSELGLVLGQDYRVLTVSFDSSDTTERALERANDNWSSLPNKEQASSGGWRFLIGDGGSAESLMKEVGFNYSPDKGEFAHSAAIMILTPDGQISQYFTGISAAARDVKLALVEASRGSIGTPLDHVLLFCFRFDQTKGRYTWAAFNLMRVGAALTLVALVVTLWLLRRGELVSSSRKG
ncbi:MAG: SCO family protein [Oligoflexia bacterium]|nr:SCO family protein [Oligoflexia bacterium]